MALSRNPEPRRRSGIDRSAIPIQLLHGAERGPAEARSGQRETRGGPDAARRRDMQPCRQRSSKVAGVVCKRKPRPAGGGGHPSRARRGTSFPVVASQHIRNTFRLLCPAPPTRKGQRHPPSPSLSRCIRLGCTAWLRKETYRYLNSGTVRRTRGPCWYLNPGRWKAYLSALFLGSSCPRGKQNPVFHEFRQFFLVFGKKIVLNELISMFSNFACLRYSLLEIMKLILKCNSWCGHA